MKRALLIAGGTIGGVGAVLTITPPNLSSTTLIASDQPVAATPSAQSPSAQTPSSQSPSAQSPSAIKKTSTKATTKATSKTTSQPKSTSQPSTSVAPTEAAPAGPASVASNANGSFTGSVSNTRYGPVQVKITVENGKIIDAEAVQAPSGSNDRYTQMAVPRLRQQTLSAQSANIQGVSGASFTSYGWYKSLVSAIAKAGL